MPQTTRWTDPPELSFQSRPAAKLLSTGYVSCACCPELSGADRFR